MASLNVKDLLFSFSPGTSEFCAVSSADGRIKIWDTIKDRLQIEFANLALVDNNLAETIPEHKPADGHLSIDYTCMQWVVSQRKKKKSKPGELLLVLGTGSGDILALDVSAAQLKWKVSNCHPGGVTAVSFSRENLRLFTTGVDGMVCQIDSISGKLFHKFQVSRKSIHSLSVSADGVMFAIASGQLKVFNSSDYTKIQKFSGHPVGVRCMTFNEDGKFILSSGIGERYVTLWKIDGSKSHSSCCVLSVEHPAVSLDCKGSFSSDGENSGLYVLAVSEDGHCYFWHGKDVQGLHSSKVTKISTSLSQPISMKNKGSLPVIYCSKFHTIEGQAKASMLIAYGFVVKPSFKKLTVQCGSDININCSQDIALLPVTQTCVSKKDKASHQVTTLDRANAEDAIIPHPTIFQDKKRKHNQRNYIADSDYGATVCADKTQDAKVQERIEEEVGGISLEDKLKSVGILSGEDVMNSENDAQFLSSYLMNWRKQTDEKISNLDATMFRKACFLVRSNRPVKKIKENLLSLLHGDVAMLLFFLVVMWKARSANEQNVVSWICYVLVNHSNVLGTSKSILDGLHKMTIFKCSASGPLLQLFGCLQLITTQIIKAEKGSNKDMPTWCAFEEDDEDEDLDEVVYGEQEMLQSSDAE